MDLKSPNFILKFQLLVSFQITDQMRGSFMEGKGTLLVLALGSDTKSNSFWKTGDMLTDIDTSS